MRRRLQFHWYVHRWYVVIVVPWLLLMGFFSYLMWTRTAPVDQHLVPIGFLGLPFEFFRDGFWQLGLIIGLFYLLPVYLAPFGLLKFDISE